MQSDLKTIRLQVLVDEKFNKVVKKGAHDSWMSVGQYMRDVVAMMDGRNYDDIADVVNAGKEIGRDGFEALSELAERRGVTVKEFCLGLLKRKEIGEEEKERDTESNDVVAAVEVDSNQISLFD